MVQFDVSRKYGSLEACFSAEGMMIEVDSYLPEKYSTHKGRSYHELLAWLYPSPAEGQSFLGQGESQSRFYEMGQLSFVPAFTPITSYYPRGISKHRVSILRIMPELLDGIAQEHFRQWSPSMIAGWNIRSQDILRGMRQLAIETLTPGLGSTVFVETLALNLLIQLLRTTSRCQQNCKPSGGLAQWQIQRITEYLADNEADDPQPSLPRLAALVGISSAHLRRAFKESTGCSIGNYVRDTKIKRARSLLSSELMVEDIARRLGFSTSHGFSSAFRRCTGETPGAFRKKVRAIAE